MNRLCDYLAGLLLIGVAFLCLSLVPVAVLFNRHPLRNYPLKVGVQWLRVVTQLMRSLGCRVDGGIDINGVRTRSL